MSEVGQARVERLPDPPPGRSGWPWQSAPLPKSESSVAGPLVSIVTPSFNQAAFLEETIRSVLLQDYPNLEYIVVDGGSTDGSVDIIRRYESHLAFWVSEPDQGAADALRKGFGRARGEVLAWLNTDDVYRPGVIRKAAERFRDDPNCGVLYGDTYWIDPESRVLGERRQTRFLPRGYLYGGADLQQPSTLWRRSAYEAAGGIDASFRFAFDTDLFCRFVRDGVRFEHVREFFASFRIHPASKSSNEIDVCRDELARIRGAYLDHEYGSLHGSVARNASRVMRAVMYARQGDLDWLVGRIPDRLRAGGSGLAAGPRSEWM
jgi:glycosyltransferase involved in cell wall biosynthesis